MPSLPHPPSGKDPDSFKDLIKGLIIELTYPEAPFLLARHAGLKRASRAFLDFPVKAGNDGV